MKNKAGNCKYLALCLLIALLAADVIWVPANAGRQDPTEPGRSITTTSVNDKKPFGIRIASGTTVETGNAAAGLLVNLGKLGLIQLSRKSKMKISYDENFVTGSLYVGKVLVSTPAGVAAKISTIDGDVVAIRGVATSLTIDTECGNTVVKVKSGEVELRARNEVKKISAGGQVSVGTGVAGKKCAK
jgi:hypothetical protein